MIFQNLSQEIEKEASEKVHVLFRTIISRHKKKLLNKLWAVEIMKFQVAVSRSIVEVIFDNEAEINILLYLMTLKLELVIWSNVTITMRGISDKLSHVIEYILKVPVQIEDVTVWQSFFVLEQEINACILRRLFETITWMIRQTLNNEAVKITIFDSDDDLIQMMFQLYIFEDCEDMKDWSMIKLSCSLKTLKVKNETYARKLLLCLWKFHKWKIR